MDMDLTMTIEGESMKMKQEMKGIVSKINEIEKIEVPAEVVQNAVEMAN